MDGGLELLVDTYLRCGSVEIEVRQILSRNKLRGWTLILRPALLSPVLVACAPRCICGIEYDKTGTVKSSVLPGFQDALELLMTYAA